MCPSHVSCHSGFHLCCYWKNATEISNLLTGSPDTEWKVQNVYFCVLLWDLFSLHECSSGGFCYLYVKDNRWSSGPLHPSLSPSYHNDSIHDFMTYPCCPSLSASLIAIKAFHCVCHIYFLYVLQLYSQFFNFNTVFGHDFFSPMHIHSKCVFWCVSRSVWSLLTCLLPAVKGVL